MSRNNDTADGRAYDKGVILHDNVCCGYLLGTPVTEFWNSVVVVIIIIIF
jgi:hypothetical protein